MSGLMATSYSFLDTLPQSMPSKKTCALTSPAPLAPNRSAGSPVINLSTRSLAGAAISRSSGNVGGAPLRIIGYASTPWTSWNGMQPQSIAYTTPPSDHQSTEKP